MSRTRAYPSQCGVRVGCQRPLVRPQCTCGHTFRARSDQHTGQHRGPQPLCHQVRVKVIRAPASVPQDVCSEAIRRRRLGLMRRGTRGPRSIPGCGLAVRYTVSVCEDDDGDNTCGSLSPRIIRRHPEESSSSRPAPVKYVGSGRPAGASGRSVAPALDTRQGGQSSASTLARVSEKRVARDGAYLRAPWKTRSAGPWTARPLFSPPV